VRGYSALQAGLLSLPFAAGQMLLAPRSAALVRRFGTKAVVASGLLVVTAALTGYQMLGIATPIWVLAALFFVQGAGMGSVMPPATESVMSVVPRERAGAGSALTNVARQVSGALGVAVLGSILAQAYRGQLSPHLGALPAAARGAATGSIEATQAVAAKLGSGSIAGRDLAVFADSAFVHAMHITTLISAVITLLGALVVVAWMPGRGAGARRAAAAEAPARAAELAGHREPVPAAVGRPAGPAALEANAAPEASAALDDAVATGAAATPASRRAGAEGPGAHAGDPVRAEGYTQ
jgi:MFS family permease